MEVYRIRLRLENYFYEDKRGRQKVFDRKLFPSILYASIFTLISIKKKYFGLNFADFEEWYNLKIITFLTR